MICHVLGDQWTLESEKGKCKKREKSYSAINKRKEIQKNEQETVPKIVTAISVGPAIRPWWNFC